MEDFTTDDKNDEQSYVDFLRENGHTEIQIEMAQKIKEVTNTYAEELSKAIEEKNLENIHNAINNLDNTIRLLFVDAFSGLCALVNTDPSGQVVDRQQYMLLVLASLKKAINGCDDYGLKEESDDVDIDLT